MAKRRTGEEVEATEAPEVATTQGPRQRVSVMPQSQGATVGPSFPSGTNAVEAALSGATAEMTEAQVAALHANDAQPTTDHPED